MHGRFVYFYVKYLYFSICLLLFIGYYDGCIFHRVIKDFIVQTGDPTGTGEGSKILI